MYELITIGSSLGGVHALKVVFSAFANFPDAF